MHGAMRYPSPAWLASITRHNLQRSLKKAFGKDIDSRRRIERTLAQQVLDTADELNLFGEQTYHYLNADDLHRGGRDLRKLVVGTMDKNETSCFIA